MRLGNPKFVLLMLLSLAQAFGPVHSTTVTQTKTRMQQLDKQINHLKQTINQAQGKRVTLNNELSITEKKIGKGIQQLRNIENNVTRKKQKITSLQQHINQLNDQLTSHQQLLAQHLKKRYEMGEYQPIKWLLNQDNPYAVTRLLTYYQYLIKSRQVLMDTINISKKNLAQDQELLNNELNALNTMQAKLHSHQKQLEQTIQYNQTIITALNKDIQSKKNQISEYQKNKAKLYSLLKTLTNQTLFQAKQPFQQMRHKLPRPINVGRNAIQTMKQGVTFFAAEGTIVHAVYPGRVVFSNWLNGYGLLMIIDHGHGFMTLYAHNQSLFKRKGTMVSGGETIAAVGHSGGIKQNGLYFEVRNRGKAISPLEWIS